MSIRGNRARGLSDRDRQEGRAEGKRVAELWLIPRVVITLLLFMDFFLSVSKWNGFRVVFPNWWQSLEGSLAWDPPCPFTVATMCWRSRSKQAPLPPPCSPYLWHWSPFSSPSSFIPLQSSLLPLCRRLLCGFVVMEVDSWRSVAALYGLWRNPSVTVRLRLSQTGRCKWRYGVALGMKA